MGNIHTSTVQSVHAYTRSDVPWEVEANRAAHGETSTGRKFGWRLYHYIASGGMRTFGRTVHQMESARRRHGLAMWLAAFWTLWAFLYFL